MESFFKDYFSGHSHDYRKYRPHYPASLFSHLAGLAPRRQRAWDCATGNGQAARGLALHFSQVFATDGSFNQIENAAGDRSIHYAVSRAECSCFQTGSLDLITVAQAMHWLDFNVFFAETDRVLVENGILAFWCYGLGRISPRVDEVIRTFFFTILGPFWPPERRYIEEEYRTISLPMDEIPAPRFVIQAEWDLHALLGYLETWSAVKRYRAGKQEDPFDIIMPQLLAAWGEAERKKKICWPVFLRIGRKT